MDSSDSPSLLMSTVPSILPSLPPKPKFDKILLAQSLLDDLVPPVSKKCEKSVNSGRRLGEGTSFTFSFHLLKERSDWYPSESLVEKEVFLLEMRHVTTENNRNQTWSLRLGKGGNIYSFVGAFGEAVPPQSHHDAPWIDEVWQSVGVNLDLNDREKAPYYIHQAGTYLRDPEYMQLPFYSPTLAVSCDENSCTVASWGQHAHVPTSHVSDALYVNKYSNCGNGVIEHTSLIHHMGEPQSSSPPLNYLNMPWAGVRRSNLQDIILSVSNEEDLRGKIFQPEKPIQSFGFPTKIPNLVDTRGFTTFAQNLKSDKIPAYSLPCGDSSGNEISCSENSADQTSKLALIAANDNACAESEVHTKNRKEYTVRCRIESTIEMRTGCKDCSLSIFNKSTNHRFGVTEIVHWSWSGVWIFMVPGEGITANDINMMFSKGDVMHVDYTNNGMEREENLALSFIHGTDKKSRDADWLQNKLSRIRFGASSGGSLNC